MYNVVIEQIRSNLPRPDFYLLVWRLKSWISRLPTFIKDKDVKDTLLVDTLCNILKMDDREDEYVRFIKLESLAILANLMAMDDSKDIILEVYKEEY